MLPLKDGERSAFYSGFSRRAFAVGDHLARQNRPVEWMGFLVDGRADLLFTDACGISKPCGRLEPGDCIGVFALAGGGLSPMNAVCIRPTTCLLLERAAFLSRIETFQAVREHLFRQALERAFDGFQALNGGGRVRDHGLGAVQKAMDLIDHHYTESLRLEDLARACGMSKFHFSRMFKAKSGFSFKEYLNRVRIAAAKRVLREKGRNVSEACFAVGFNDLSYFSRVFRASEGVSPSAFRRGFDRGVPGNDRKGPQQLPKKEKSSLDGVAATAREG